MSKFQKIIINGHHLKMIEINAMIDTCHARAAQCFCFIRISFVLCKNTHTHQSSRFESRFLPLNKETLLGDIFSEAVGVGEDPQMYFKNTAKYL